MFMFMFIFIFIHSYILLIPFYTPQKAIKKKKTTRKKWSPVTKRRMRRMKRMKTWLLAKLRPVPVRQLLAILPRYRYT